MKKKWFVVLCVSAILIITVTIALYSHSKKLEKLENKGDLIFSNIHSALSEYPKLPSPFTYTKFYYCDGSAEYLLLRNGSNQVTGVRTVNGEIYYMDQKSWVIGEDGNLVPVEDSEDPVSQIAETITDKFLTSKDLTYTCHKASGRDLPLWIYPNETYIMCKRPDYTDCVEVMVYEDNDPKYLRWDIAHTSDDAVLFLYADCTIRSSSDEDLTVFTWGKVEQAIVDVLFKNS